MRADASPWFKFYAKEKGGIMHIKKHINIHG